MGLGTERYLYVYSDVVQRLNLVCGVFSPSNRRYVFAYVRLRRAYCSTPD